MGRPCTKKIHTSNMLSWMNLKVLSKCIRPRGKAFCSSLNQGIEREREENRQFASMILIKIT
jgi:hypothetical protein